MPSDKISILLADSNLLAFRLLAEALEKHPDFFVARLQ